MNPCAVCGIDLVGNEGHGHGAREIAAWAAGKPMLPPFITKGACVDAVAACLTPEETLRALSGDLQRLVFFVKGGGAMTVSRRRDVIEQAFRDSVAWLEVGHDFDVILDRAPASATIRKSAIVHMVLPSSNCAPCCGASETPVGHPGRAHHVTTKQGSVTCPACLEDLHR